jgi:hypothetical protein
MEVCVLVRSTYYTVSLKNLLNHNIRKVNYIMGVSIAMGYGMDGQCSTPSRGVHSVHDGSADHPAS